MIHTISCLYQPSVLVAPVKKKYNSQLVVLFFNRDDVFPTQTGYIFLYVVYE